MAHWVDIVFGGLFCPVVYRKPKYSAEAEDFHYSASAAEVLF